MSHKFDSVHAQAAYAVAGHGFAEEIGDMETDQAVLVMATISPVIMRNLGEEDVAQDLEAAAVEETTVIFMEDDQGFVTTLKVGDLVHVSQQFDAYQLKEEV